MIKRPLGNSGIEITPIGVGAFAIGGENWEFGWGPQDDQDSIDAIHAALDRGINWIDTAAVYGLGHSETIVGRAIKSRAVKPWIFTKCSLIWNDARVVSHSLQAVSIEREAEGSLRRLGVDTIDLYQIHWAGWRGRPESESPGTVEEAIGALEKLRQKGKIRAIGVSNFDASQMARALAVANIASLQPPYSLLARTSEAEILPYALEHNIGVIVYAPMATGLLSGSMTRERFASLPSTDFRLRHPRFQEPAFTRGLRLVEVLRGIGARHDVTAGAVAIAWTLVNPAVTGAIVGMRNASQVSGVAPAAELKLTAEDLDEITRELESGS